ncbi:hypothetical protein [Micromonospora chersina]|uniref:hypothetical protein n=1 Tax=Micromonospora chersina TaxID=47854 RepID=UPI00371264CB
MTGDDTTDRVLAALLTMQRQSWEQGVTGHALLDLGLGDLAVLVADAAVTRQHPDGRLGDVSGEAGAVNGAACGEVVRYAATTDGDPRFTAALDAHGWYAALTGVADGWLPASWLGTGAELLAAARRRVDRRGRVTGVSGAPDFTRPGTSPEAQAFHLLGHAALGRARAAVSRAG